LANASAIIEEVKDEAVVDSVGFTASLKGEKSLQDVVGRLKAITRYIRLAGVLLVGALGLTSFLVLLIIISLRMVGKKGEVEILSLIGATPGFIKNPIVIEANIYAFLGVFIGWLLSFIGWLYVSPFIFGYFRQIPILPKDPLQFFALFLIILGAEIVIGLTLAISGSLIAVGRSLKKKR